MLDNETKRQINSLRDILVGKLPDPKAQVEQITNGLIYKFMNDMDDESVSMGGKATYFSGKFKKYSWKNLMDTKTSGVEKVSLYSEAIEQMYNNENLPELFREIFKNSFLPFKDASTLNMFLKEVNKFHYSHSEKLGDAFEYLLSFMGSQGDAGQFRTPRHIIDFIVKVVNPKKNETILDPACGTAGFLISSYKHILNQNTKKNLGDGLNASDRKKIGENLNGYDISPDMVKISLVNMYLHKFTNPKIYEYDTLSSEERWNEYYDIILANPPFFSPKGGITPHNKFGIKSSRAEILFVDYINEHLKPNGRAGIIVPEGIIFQSNIAYKQVRKTLVDKSLIGIISLPPGIFNPYSGVKTSLLILDKERSKKEENIFFGIIESDGFTLTSSRKRNKDDDLGRIFLQIENFLKKRKISEDKKFFQVNKSDILKNSDISFSFNDYITKKTGSAKNKYILLGNLIEESKIRYNNEKRNIWSVSNKEGFINPEKIFSHQIASDDIKNYKKVDKNNFAYNPSRINVGSIAFNQSNGFGFVSPMYVVFKNIDEKKLNNKYLFNLLKSEFGIKKIREKSIGTVRNTLKFKNLINIAIPLPSIESQNQIVEELDGYQKIIDGCRQVVENYKPSIDIDPNWKVEELGNICKINPKKSEVKLDFNSDVSFIPMEDVKENNLLTLPLRTKKLSEVTTSYTYFKTDDILLAKVTPCFENGKCTIVKNLVNDVGFGSSEFIVLRCGEKVKKEWVYCFIITSKFKQLGVESFTGTSGLRRVPKDFVARYKIPLPSIDVQERHIKKIYSDVDFIDKNLEMIQKTEDRINNKINSIWLS